MRGRVPYLEAFLVSLAVIVLEVSYTRIFSFKLVYYFSYLIIGISLLGLGAGGVFVSVVQRLRSMPVERFLPGCCVAAGLGVLAGYPFIALLPVNALEILVGEPGVAEGLREVAKLALVALTLFVPFFAAGLGLAMIFARHTAAIGPLYAADLLGAGLGCALIIPLLVVLTPPGCVMLAGALFCVAALPSLRTAGAPARAVAVAATLVLLVAVGWANRLPDPVADKRKSMGPGQYMPSDLQFSRWDPVFRVDVLRLDSSTMILSHDGMWGSVIRRFDGDVETLRHFEDDERAHPFRLLKPAPRVAIIGSAGGNEILASLYFGARNITAIELNPVTVSLLTDHFADYSGRLTTLPQVRIVNAEARSYLQSNPARYDLVWFVAPDSYAAMNAATSGAFVLSESYLYTVEMLEEALAQLEDDGLLCAQFGELFYDRSANRTTRFLSTAREAMRRRGIDAFDEHVLVSTAAGVGGQLSTVILRKTPFAPADADRLAASTGRLLKGKVRFPPPVTNADPPEHPVQRAIRLPAAELADWYRSWPFLVTPVTDDAPFFWHFVTFGRAWGDTCARRFDRECGQGERLLSVLLCLAVVFAAVFLLAPLLLRRQIARELPFKAHAVAYFGAIGVAFMFLEVSLIQRLTLFLGYPTYSLTVTLFAMLVSTGLGSFFADRLRTRRRSEILRGLALALIALVAFYRFGLGPVVDHAVGWPIFVKVSTVIALLSPLGLCLGVFMPLGLRTVSGLSPHREEFVAWAWAVNGFASVVSSVLATMLSMTVGFGHIMLIALAIYMVAIAVMWRLPEPPPQN